MGWKPRKSFKVGHTDQYVCIRAEAGRIPRILYKDGIGYMRNERREIMYFEPGAAQLMCDILNRENAVLGKELSEKFGSYDQSMREENHEQS